jgi:hypothetical protein
MKYFFEEIADEFFDFFEDYFEHLFHQKPSRPPRKREINMGGAKVLVRPAYLFAERIDNLLKMVFGVSIAVSAFTTSFLGFKSLSDFVDFLIASYPGRFAMLVIGISYLLIASWKLMHLGEKTGKVE